jgi:hypothetical protein
MAEGYRAGSAYVSILPDLTGIHRKIGDEFRSMEPEFVKYGQTAGKRFAAGFTDQLRASFARLPKPDIRPQVDDAKAKLELDDLARTRTAKVKVDVDKSALARIKGLLGKGASGAGSGLGGLSGALSSAGPYAIAAGALVAGALVPAVLPAAVGAGFAGLGVFAADKFSKSLQRGLGTTKNTFLSVVRDATAPLGRSFSELLPGIDRFIKSMGPDLKAAFGASEPFLRSFIMSGEQFARIVLPSIAGLLNKAAPFLPKLAQGFAEISQGIAGFFNSFTPKQIDDAFTDFKGVAGFLEIALPAIGSAAGGLASGFASAGHAAMVWAPRIGQAFLTGAQVVIAAARGMTDDVLDSFKFITHGAAAAFGWIPGLGGKLKAADAAVGNWRKSVDANFDAAQAKVNSWSQALDRAPKIATLKGNISDLSYKLAQAQSELKNPDLTKTRRAAITANIAQLQQQLARARAELATLNGTTAVTYVQTVRLPPGGRGLKFFAAGTPSAPPGWAWVGERGPELVRFRGGEQVIPNRLAAPVMVNAPARLPGYANGTGPLRMAVSYQGPQGGAIEAIIKDLRFSIQAKAGGDVQAHLGRGKVR